MRRIPILHTALAILAIIFSIALVRAFGAPAEPIPVVAPRAVPPLSDDSEEAALATPARETFSQIELRPPFSPTRKPLPEPQTEGAAVAASGAARPPEVVLIGVIIAGDLKRAILKPQGAAEAQRLTMWGEIGGWKITEIAADHITIGLGAATHRIDLQALPNGQVVLTGDDASSEDVKTK